MADAELAGGDLDVQLGANVASGDKMYMVDVSNTTGVHSDAGGTSVQITAAQLANAFAVLGGYLTNAAAFDAAGAAAAAQSAAASDATTKANAAQAASQPLDSDLTAIAGLVATTNNVIQSVASAWASRTPAQLKATMSLVKGDVGLGNVDNTADSAKTLTGDAGGTLSATTVDKIKGSAVDPTAPTVAQTFLWDDVAAKWVPKSLSGDVTTTKAGVTTIGAAAVSYAKIQNIAANRMLGNNTGSAATALELSATDVKTFLAIAESDVANLTSDLALLAPIANPTFTGVATAPAFTASGLTGATTPVRFVGGGSNAAPASGTFLAGDYVVTTSGRIFVCAVGGSPGVWLNAGTAGLGDILTTKGDLLVGTGTGNVARLGVGAKNQAPTVDATDAHGMVWGNPASGRDNYLSPTGAYEGIPRWANAANTAVFTASGTICVAAIWLPNNLVCTAIEFYCQTTAAVSPTNWWMALCNSSFAQLRATADQLTGAIAAGTFKKVNLASNFTTTYSGLYYVAIMVAAGTVPTLAGFSGGGTAFSNKAPQLSSDGLTGQTVPKADTTVLVTSATGKTVVPWVAVYGS